MQICSDEKYMEKCFELAKKGGKNVFPNPLVGCVVVKNGKIISKGYHKKFGDFHAERNALLKDIDFEGATLYVNLEPCSHFGKTPPCVDLIIEKKIKRVVFSTKDPNPLVDSVLKLKNAGIEVTSGVLEKEGEKLNKIFIKNMKKNLPYVAIKTATTLDSKIATISYNSKWITGACARQKVMELRDYYQAILVGSNTVKLDNPKLTSRIEGGKNPIRIIIDRYGKLEDDLNVFKKNSRVIVATDNKEKIYPKHVEKIPYKNPKSLLKRLYKMGIYSILIEGGGKINSAFIKEADEIYHFIAPKILGGGIDFISGLNPSKLSDSIEVYDLNIEKFGKDILLNYRLKS